MKKSCSSFSKIKHASAADTDDPLCPAGTSLLNHSTDLVQSGFPLIATKKFGLQLFFLEYFQDRIESSCFV